MTENIPQIIHLPNGRWCLQLNGNRSDSADYSQRIVATLGRTTLAAQTEYYDKEMVWEIKGPMTFETQDKTL